jgi:hypothetical protein
VPSAYSDNVKSSVSAPTARSQIPFRFRTPNFPKRDRWIPEMLNTSTHFTGEVASCCFFASVSSFDSNLANSAQLGSRRLNHCYLSACQRLEVTFRAKGESHRYAVLANFRQVRFESRRSVSQAQQPDSGREKSPDSPRIGSSRIATE